HEDVECLQQPDRIRVLADVRRALQFQASACEAGWRSFPHLMRTHVVENGRKRGDPGSASHSNIAGNGGLHSDLATPLDANRTDVQVLPGPSRGMNVCSGLYCDIVLNGDQVKRSGQVNICPILKVVADGRA